MDKQYKVIKEYTSYCFGFPLSLPVGTILSYWKERGFYTATADGYVVCVDKWAVEAWHDFFKEV